MPRCGSVGDSVACEVEANVRKRASMKMCARCHELILDSDQYTLECFGRCKETIHWDCFPNGTHEHLDVLRQMKNAVYACDTCIALHEFDDTEEMHKKMNEVLHSMTKLQGVFDFVESFDDRVRKILREELSGVGKNSAAPSNDTFRYNLRSTNKARPVSSTTTLPPLNSETVNVNKEASFADVVKNSKSVSVSEETPRSGRSKNLEIINKARSTVTPKKPNSRIIIKPKNGKKACDTKKMLSEKVKPSNFKVKDIHTRKDGSILVEVQDNAVMMKLKQKIENELCDHCDVEVNDALKPTMKIVGINEEMNEEELKTTLIDNNEVMEDVKHFKLKKIVTKDKDVNENYDAIIEIDARTFQKVMKQKKLICGWDRCQVVDALDVVRCYRCSGFNHKVGKCTAKKQACPRCAGDHPVKECNSSDVKCINCVRSNLSGNKSNETNHCAWSDRCPLYLKMKERKRQLVDYSE